MVKRSVMNMNFPSIYEYAFIDHMKGGTQFGPGTGATWLATGGPLWTQNLDADGWPAYSTAVINKSASFGAIRIPDSTNFAGPYTIDGFGSGTITLSTGTWTLGAATGVTKASNTLTVTDQGAGVRWTAQLTYSGTRQTIGINAPTVDPLNTGKFIRQVRFYRTEDATDLGNGKVFRTSWKQIYVDLNPSFIRFMNWFGDNDARICRFENRTTPSRASYTGNYDWVTGPRYGETTGTNQIVLAAVSGTPASMQHGEIAQTRITNTVVRVPAFSGGSSINKTVTAVTLANPGVVTCAGHGFNTGDKIIHLISAGMTELDRRICTITVSDVDTYSIGIDTTSFTAFTAGTSNQYLSLQVGTGNDRRDYPIVFNDGYTLASNYGLGYLVAGDAKTFYFDKTVYAAKDSDGTIVQGVWLFPSSGSDLGHKGGMPLEICTACINELNEMSADPIGMWINIPHWALLSDDPDYSADSNLAVKSVDVVINGANGYAALDSTVNLIVEYSNETWNSAGAAFYQTPYLSRRGFQRWGAGLTSSSDAVSYAALRSYLMCKDIQAAFPRVTYPRIKYVLGFWGSQGIALNGHNYQRTHGNTAILTDALNPNADKPISVHDYAAYAAYIYNDDSNATYSLATCETAWTAASGNVAKEAVCATYVQGMQTFGGSQTFDNYYNTLLPAYATAMGALGKEIIMYEGGWDRIISGTAAQQNFLKAAKRSRAFANALANALNTYDTTDNAQYPADYIALDSRWGHAPDDFYSSGVEGGALDLAWTLMGLRNNGLRQMVIKT
jgi:hypothetical protein